MRRQSRHTKRNSRTDPGVLSLLVISAKFMSEEGERWSVDTIISAAFLLQEGNTGKQNASKLQENKVNSWNKDQVDGSKRGKWGEVVSLFSSSLSLKQRSCKGSSGWANPLEWGIREAEPGKTGFLDRATHSTRPENLIYNPLVPHKVLNFYIYCHITSTNFMLLSFTFLMSHSGTVQSIVSDCEVEGQWHSVM